MIEAGTILQDRYRVEKQIGQGGMGTVFVAVDERFGSKVAIKETFFEDENLKKAFEREARLLNSLKHPALPKVNDFFTEDDSQFIVMEYITGEDLSTILEKSGEAFPIEDVLNWGDQLCDALEYLHSQEMPVIHRDIKPQNLKLTPTGQIILLDFGLAKGNPTDASHHTAAKSIFGFSRNYASLEQIQGTGTDPQSDLYSLAATLYHLASGIPPADALTRAMNVLNAQSDPLIPAHFVDRNIPKGVAEVLQKTMALNAAERPSSAGELRSMLTDCDKNIVFENEQMNAKAFAATDLLNQETKLMSAKTNVENPGNAGVKTEVLPKNIADRKSLETKVVDRSGTTQEEDATVVGAIAGGAPRGRRTFATAASVLLLIAGAVSAFYLYNSQSFAEAEPTPNVKTKLMPSGGETTNANVEIVETEKPDSAANLESADSTTSQEVPTDSVKQTPKETAKTVEKTEKPKTSGSGSSKETKTVQSTDGRNRIVVYENGEKVIIDGDKIETDTMVMEGDKVTLKKWGKGSNPIVRPPLTPEQMKFLSPEQLQKIKDLEKLRREQMKYKKPPPPPEPKYESPPPNR
jgi:serine/threonine protein kinase